MWPGRHRGRTMHGKPGRLCLAVALAVMGGVASGEPIPEDARPVLAAEADDIDAVVREIRKEYPQYADWSDAELAEAISAKLIAEEAKVGDLLCWYSLGALDAIRDYHDEWSRSFKDVQTHLGSLLSKASSPPAIHRNILEWSRLARDLRKEAAQWGVTCGVRHVLHDIAVPSN